ncbi:MAG: cation/H(+) antiporter [Rhodospirillaceae bacterium]|nr:cation/H(+) antiporter [Rhodospirillaceae bacterium]
MEHATDHTGLAFVVFTALACGMVFVHFRQPPLVGYLLAGALLGPTGFKVVQSEGMIAGFAEIGVLMLLFVVGMELSVRSLKYTWRLALPAVIMQTSASLIVMFAASSVLGLSNSAAVLLGFVVALSLTAVAVKLLEEIGSLRARVGRITVAVLIAQDLAFLPMLLIIENMGSSGFDVAAATQVGISALLLFGLVRLLLRQGRQHLPFYKIIVGHVDLSPLAGLVYCFGGSALMGAIGLSPAYGAFLAGLAIGNSAERQPILNVIRPIQSIMLMVFFLSIGLLLDLDFVWKNLGTVLLLFLVVTLFKSALNIFIFRLLNESWQRAFMSGVLISQLGEFSFLLVVSAAAIAAITPGESKLIISVTVLSLALSPFWLSTARRLQRIAERRLTTLKLVFEATFVEERLLARRGTRWTRRIAAILRYNVNILKERIVIKRAIGRTKENSLVDLSSRNSKSDDA